MHHTPWRTLSRVLALGTVLLAGTSATPVQRAEAIAADTIVMADPGSPATLDPAISYDYASPPIIRPTYEGLVAMKGTSSTEIAGVLATSWTTNPQRTIWTFQLRRGVTFHDGTPFNAAAVKYSIARAIGVNAAPAYVFGQFMGAADVKILGPYIVQFRLHAPAPRLLYALASQYGTYMVSPTAIKGHQVGNDWAQKWIAAGHDAGSGPYMVSQYQPNQSITLIKYPGYWRGWAGKHASRLLFAFVEKTATRREMLERGDADISLFFTPEDMRAMQRDPALAVDAGSIAANWTLIPTERGPFASKAARLALAYAFDYQGFLHGLLKGFASPAQGPLTHYVDGHDNALPIFQTDIAKAKALFAQAGVAPGTAVTLWYSTDDETQRDVALVTQGQLALCGIKVSLIGKDSATYFNALFGSEPMAQRPDLWIGGWSGDYNDALAWFLPLYHSRASNASAGGANSGEYHNAEVDRLTDQAGVTVDAAKRRALVSRIQHILTVDDPAAVYVGEESNSTTYRRALHGYYYNTVDVLTYDFYAMYK